MYGLLHVGHRKWVRPTGATEIEVVQPPARSTICSRDHPASRARERSLVAVMTIKFARGGGHLNRMGVKAHHLHSEIDTIERTEIVNALRLGHRCHRRHQPLREGLDIPEVSLVAIFDADRQLRTSAFAADHRSCGSKSTRKVLLTPMAFHRPWRRPSMTLERASDNRPTTKPWASPRTIVKALPVMGDTEDATITSATTGSDGKRRLIARGAVAVMAIGLNAFVWGQAHGAQLKSKKIS